MTDLDMGCTCGTSPMTYEGPERDCPVHGECEHGCMVCGGGDHCHGCGKPRPKRGYIECYECGHRYRTRWHLLFAYWREHYQGLRRSRRWVATASASDDPLLAAMAFAAPSWRDWIPHLRPSRICFCQCCLHDF